ncbi:MULTISPECIES: hypothetical protein [Psychrobacter]|nr:MULTISPECIES: hypothetical protein [Psychrobacter]
MSAPNSKTFTSIFDNQETNMLKEQERLAELNRQAKVQQVKFNK